MPRTEVIVRKEKTCLWRENWKESTQGDGEERYHSLSRFWRWAVVYSPSLSMMWITWLRNFLGAIIICLNTKLRCWQDILVELVMIMHGDYGIFRMLVGACVSSGTEQTAWYSNIAQPCREVEPESESEKTTNHFPFFDANFEKMLFWWKTRFLAQVVNISAPLPMLL